MIKTGNCKFCDSTFKARGVEDFNRQINIHVRTAHYNIYIEAKKEQDLMTTEVKRLNGLAKYNRIGMGGCVWVIHERFLKSNEVGLDD